MSDYDPKQEVELIKIAWEMVNGLKLNPTLTPEGIIDTKTKRFDLACKALSGTVFGR